MPEGGPAPAAVQDEDGEAAEDALYAGRVRLLQPRRGHRAGTDAVLLAAAVAAGEGERVADVGAATGAVGLMVAARHPGARLLFVERDPGLAALCARNLLLNGLAPDRARVVVADVLAPPQERRAAGLPAASADLVVTNPPYLDEGRARLSPDARRAAAHALPPGGLAAWLTACTDLLGPRGRLALIHRADALRAVLDALPSGFGAIRLRFVHPRAEAPATRLLLATRRGSRAPLDVLPALVLHGSDGAFTPEARALHDGSGSLAGEAHPGRKARAPVSRSATTSTGAP